MKPWAKLLLFQAWFLLGLPLLAVACAIAPGLLEAKFMGRLFGQFVFLFIVIFWCWQWYVYAHYRHCRQEEFLFLVQTAAATQAPLEKVLRAYPNDRPHEHLFRATLLFFVFPGYYWLHVTRSFDARLSRLMRMLERGLPLHEALPLVPGLASRETMLAAAVGEFSGKLDQAMHRLPDHRSGPAWLEVAPRFFYPLLVVGAMVINTMFLMVFIVPKFERIFLEFKMTLPMVTEVLIVTSRWCVEYWYVLVLFFFLSLGLINLWLLSSLVRWHTPLLGRLYRMRVRGEFLQMLGIMLETGRPLPAVLERILEAQLLPKVMQTRVRGLLADVQQGRSFPEALARHELTDGPSLGLITTAQKANNLVWTLQELGEALIRRSARYSVRLAMSVFPLMICGCAILVGLIAVAMFSPLTTLMEGLVKG